MENKPTFDLEAALRQWRQNLESSPAFRADNLEELEAHLRDAVTGWREKGLSEEESFGVAAGRLGRTGPLAAEFAKVNGSAVWADRMFWMAAGLQVWLFVNCIANMGSDALVMSGLKGLGAFDHAPTAGRSVVFAGALALAQFGLLAVCLTMGSRWARGRSEQLSRGAGALLRRPWAATAALGVGMMLASAAEALERMFMAKWVPLQGYVFMRQAMMVYWIWQPLVVAGLTVYLARRRLQARVAG